VAKQQRHAPCGILKMSVNGASTIFSFASWVSYVPIGFRYPFMRYWQPLVAKTTATCSMRHPENDVNGVSRIIGAGSWVIEV